MANTAKVRMAGCKIASNWDPTIRWCQVNRETIRSSGTDYGHRDTATEVEALKRLPEGGDLPEATANKNLARNPGILYGIA